MKFIAGDIARVLIGEGTRHDATTIRSGEEYEVKRTEGYGSEARVYLDAPRTDGSGLQEQWFYARRFELVKRGREAQGAKPANPKQAYGDKKPPVHLIHSIAALHESAALHSGGRKYNVNNYLIDPVEAMTYIGAMKRHIDQWVSGERVDAKELVHHLGAVRACAGILLTAEACGTLIDNRPCALPQAHPPSCTPERYKAATAAAFEEVQNTVEHLNTLYPPKQ